MADQLYAKTENKVENVQNKCIENSEFLWFLESGDFYRIPS